MMFIGLFLLGCIGTQEQITNVEEEIVEEETTIPPEVEKIVPKIRFIDYPLEVNAMDGARFVTEVKDVQDVEESVFLYLWKESTNPSRYPSDYVYSSESFTQLQTKSEHYETYVIIDEPGKYYARSLVVYEGEYYWSEEAILNVLTTEGKTLKSYTVNINYASLNPVNIEVNKGEVVVITFLAAEDSHPNGVRILSPGWKDSPSLKPGQSFKAEFVADTSFSYRMYWLAGNLLKATGTVTVN